MEINRNNSLNDASSLPSWRGNDLDSFEELVRRHQKRMVNIALRITGDFGDACEVTQDAFVAAFRDNGSFGGLVPFESWLASITVSLARSRLQLRMTQHLGGTVAPGGSSGGDGGAAPGRVLPAASAPERLEQGNLHERLQHCVMSLDIDFREAIVLRDLLNFSSEETSAILKVREATIRSRLFRAREMVRDGLKRLAGEP